MSESAYLQKRDRLSTQLRANNEAIRLEKTTSNLFRTRNEAGGGNSMCAG